MKSPVLFLVFNRLETTKKVFESIRSAKPPRLYLASDGPRLNTPGEESIVAEVRESVLSSIDWDCDVQTLFRKENLGCGKAVYEAITWFFENEKEGIILEDDCLPNNSFFTFCDELLNYYRDEKKVMHISGNQFVDDFDNGASYYFARVQHCWGWATWADRWAYFQYELTCFDEKYLIGFSSNKYVRKYWSDILKTMKMKVANNETDIWDYQWTFKIVEKAGLCINPACNLVSNIGFGENCTHTADSLSPIANMPTYEISSIIHPRNYTVDEQAVNYIYEKVYGIALTKSFLNQVLELINQVIAAISIFIRNHYLRRKLRDILRYQMFNPGIIGLFINPSYFARKGLFDNISDFSKNLTGRLLDVGCGTKPYRDLFNVEEYIGLEYDIGLNKNYNKHADCLYRGEELPFDSSIFNSVVSFQVLEHVPHPAKLLQEINRVLKNDGMLLLTTPFIWDEHLQPHDYYRYTSYGINKLLIDNGFEIVESRKSIDNVSIIFQIINIYIYKIFVGNDKLFNRLIIILLTGPSNIIGLIFRKFLPKNIDLYLDNVVLAKKINQKKHD